MMIALILGLAFTMIRTKMCSVISAEPDRQLQTVVLDALSHLKTAALERIPQAKIQEVMAGPQTIQAAYEASRIASVLDMPFFCCSFLL